MEKPLLLFERVAFLITEFTAYFNNSFLDCTCCCSGALLRSQVHTPGVLLLLFGGEAACCGMGSCSDGAEGGRQRRALLIWSGGRGSFSFITERENIQVPIARNRSIVNLVVQEEDKDVCQKASAASSPQSSYTLLWKWPWLCCFQSSLPWAPLQSYGFRDVIQKVKKVVFYSFHLAACGSSQCQELLCNLIVLNIDLFLMCVEQFIQQSICSSSLPVLEICQAGCSLCEGSVFPKQFCAVPTLPSYRGVAAQLFVQTLGKSNR